MSNEYLKAKQERRMQAGAFPLAFAFSQKQLHEGLAKLGATLDEVVSIGNGGFVRKADAPAFSEMLIESALKHDAAIHRSKGRTDGGYLFEGLVYELGNHEFCITGCPEDALQALGITAKELETDDAIATTLRAAIEHYRAKQETKQ